MRSFGRWVEDFEPAGLNVEEMRKVFARLGFRYGHLSFLIEMINDIKSRFLMENDPHYTPSYGDKCIGAALDCCSICLRRVMLSLNK